MTDTSDRAVQDPLYGGWSLPVGVAAIITTPTFQRLRRVNQSGASQYAHPYKTITRYDHSIGVYLLLRRLGAPHKEEIAGLLHDISHTAFSHVIDIVFYSQEQDYHERIRWDFLNRPDLVAALHEVGLEPHDLMNETQFGLLEQPLPALCADRVDYSLRDALAAGVVGRREAGEIIDDLVTVDGRLAMRTIPVARRFQTVFQTMNDHHWASQKENYLYETLARAIELGLGAGIICHDDLLTDDQTVEARLRSAGDPRILTLLEKLTDPPAAEALAFQSTRPIKQRAIDPPVIMGGQLIPLSALDDAGLPEPDSILP